MGNMCPGGSGGGSYGFLGRKRRPLEQEKGGVTSVSKPAKTDSVVLPHGSDGSYRKTESKYAVTGSHNAQGLQDEDDLGRRDAVAMETTNGGDVVREMAVDVGNLGDASGVASTTEGTNHVATAAEDIRMDMTSMDDVNVNEQLPASGEQVRLFFEASEPDVDSPEVVVSDRKPLKTHVEKINLKSQTETEVKEIVGAGDVETVADSVVAKGKDHVLRMQLGLDNPGFTMDVETPETQAGDNMVEKPSVTAREDLGSEAGASCDVNQGLSDNHTAPAFGTSQGAKYIVEDMTIDAEQSTEAEIGSSGRRPDTSHTFYFGLDSLKTGSYQADVEVEEKIAVSKFGEVQG